jgi:predicted phosphodiesterase
MKLYRMRPRNLNVLTFGLVFLIFLAWASAGLGSEAGPLPARDWNQSQLQRIEIPGGATLIFAVLGDNRSNPAVFKALLNQMDRDPGLAFAIDLGDLVETGTVKNFSTFLDQVRQYLRLPLLTVIGNHDLDKDRSSSLYQKIFGPDYYAFSIKGNYFIVVNDVEKTGIGQAQWRWLEEELQKSQAYKTRLVFFHTPLFDPRRGGRHALSKDTGRKLAALFQHYRVTHIFAGHIHSYFSGNWNGVPCTITGGGGAPLAGGNPGYFFYHYLKVSLGAGKVSIKVQRVASKGTF